MRFFEEFVALRNDKVQHSFPAYLARLERSLHKILGLRTVVVAPSAIRDCPAIDQYGEMVRSAQAQQSFAHALRDDRLWIGFAGNIVQE